MARQQNKNANIFQGGGTDGNKRDKGSGKAKSSKEPSIKEVPLTDDEKSIAQTLLSIASLSPYIRNFLPQPMSMDTEGRVHITLHPNDPTLKLPDDIEQRDIPGVTIYADGVDKKLQIDLDQLEGFLVSDAAKEFILRVREHYHKMPAGVENRNFRALGGIDNNVQIALATVEEGIGALREHRELQRGNQNTPSASHVEPTELRQSRISKPTEPDL